VVAAVEAGRLVVIPTDTVYGVAVKLDAPGGIAAIFRVKGRPEQKPIPVLAANVRQLEAIVTLDDRARCLVDEFWPGPLTLVLPRAQGFIVDLGDRGAKGVAVRVPNRQTTLDLLEATGPLAVTSANRSGEPPAVTVTEARAALGSQIEVYYDDGPVGGLPSTVVSLVDDVKVLRTGPINDGSLHACLDRCAPA
jgi:L-threonylcarbamoyladenylate synthase